MRFSIAIVPFVLSCASMFAEENKSANAENNSHGIAAIAQSPTSLSPIAITPVPSRRSKQAVQQPKASPRARCLNSEGFYFAGSFIYWKTQFDVLDTIIDTSSVQVSTTGVPLIAKIKDPNFEYSPGFKLGAGYNFKRDTWDTFFNWTRIRSHTSKNFSSSAFGLINLLVSPTLGGNTVEHSAGINNRWKTLFNSLDWELGKIFLVGRYLALRPFAGVKGGWLHTSLKVNQQASTNDRTVNEKLTNRNWGVGPRLGINTRWILSDCNLGFVANFAGSLLLEQVKSKLFVRATTPAPVTSVVKAIIKHQVLAPVVEVFLGLDWGTCYNEERYYFNLAVGVEGQYWASQQLFGTVLATNPSNNLNMYGLTATMRFDF